MRVGTHGGTGINSMSRDFLMNHNLPLSLRDDFRAGLQRLRREHVDIFIGNHQHQCNTMGRFAKIMSGNADAFIDAKAWPAFLDETEQILNHLLQSEETNTL